MVLCVGNVVISSSFREGCASSLWHLYGIYTYTLVFTIQYNLNGSNPDGSFTLDDSNSFFSPYKILPIVQGNKYLGILSYYIKELYVVCTH